MEISDSLLDFLAKALAVVGGIASLLEVIRRMGRKSERDRLQQDIEMISKLPVDDPRTERALSEVYAKLEKLQNDEYAKSRDTSGMVLGAILSVAFGGLTALFVILGSWWWIAAVLCGLLTIVGIYGLATSTRLAVRDEGGTILVSHDEEKH